MQTGESSFSQSARLPKRALGVGQAKGATKGWWCMLDVMVWQVASPRRISFRRNPFGGFAKQLHETWQVARVLIILLYILVCRPSAVLLLSLVLSAHPILLPVSFSKHKDIVRNSGAPILTL